MKALRLDSLYALVEITSDGKRDYVQIVDFSRDYDILTDRKIDLSRKYSAYNYRIDEIRIPKWLLRILFFGFGYKFIGTGHTLYRR